MQLSEVYLALGEENLQQILRHISLGKLRTYQLFERIKVRLHLSKLNSETLRKSSHRFWQRLQEHDEELATDLAQALLIGHLDMIQAVLNQLGIPHEEGFFAKDLDATSYLTEGWQGRVYEEQKEHFPKSVLLFYVNHLAFELEKDPAVFAPAAV